MIPIDQDFPKDYRVIGIYINIQMRAFPMNNNN